MPAKHPPDLRQRALDEVRVRHRPIAQVARELGIPEPRLRGWLDQARQDDTRWDRPPNPQVKPQMKPARRIDGGSRRAWMVAIGTVMAIGALVTLVITTVGGNPANNATAAVPGTSVPASATGPSGTKAPTGTPTATPTATPTPAASRTPAPGRTAPTAPAPNQPGCASRPSSCGLPDATNTGVPAGVALSVLNGNQTITKAGTVIDRKDIRGCILIKAANVTIKRSKVTCRNFIVIASWTENYSGGGLLIEDVEIDCQNTNGTGIGSYGLTARRVEIRGCENGLDVDRDVTVTDSYIHDLYEGSTGHADGMQFAGGANITVRGNTILNNGGTSAIISHPTGNSNVLITGNLMAGGAFTLYCPRDRSTNFRVINNRFSTIYYPKGGAYGPWDYCGKVAEERGNVWDADLKPL